MTSPIATAATAAAATAAELRRAPHRAVRHCEIRASMAPRPPGAAQAHHGRALPRPERRQRHRASASAAHSKARMPNFSSKNRLKHGTVRSGSTLAIANVTLPSGPFRTMFTATTWCGTWVSIHMLNAGGVLGRRPWRRAPRAMEAQLGMNLSQWSDDASWAADVAGRSQRTRDNYYRARWPYGGVDTAKIGSTSQT